MVREGATRLGMMPDAFAHSKMTRDVVLRNVKLYYEGLQGLEQFAAPTGHNPQLFYFAKIFIEVMEQDELSHDLLAMLLGHA